MMFCGLRFSVLGTIGVWHHQLQCAIVATSEARTHATLDTQNDTPILNLKMTTNHCTQHITIFAHTTWKSLPWHDKPVTYTQTNGDALESLPHVTKWWSWHGKWWFSTLHVKPTKLSLLEQNQRVPIWFEPFKMWVTENLFNWNITAHFVFTNSEIDLLPSHK